MAARQRWRPGPPDAQSCSQHVVHPRCKIAIFKLAVSGHQNIMIVPCLHNDFGFPDLSRTSSTPGISVVGVVADASNSWHQQTESRSTPRADHVMESGPCSVLLSPSIMPTDWLHPAWPTRFTDANEMRMSAAQVSRCAVPGGQAHVDMIRSRKRSLAWQIW